MDTENNSGAIWVIANPKGGAGKSTVATNLAVLASRADYSVCLIDSDPNKNQGAKAWYGKRQANVEEYGFGLFEFRESYGDIFDTVQARARENEIVIVDCGGLDSTEFRSAIATAHLLIVPVECDIYDIEGEMTGFSSDPIVGVNATISQLKAGNRTLQSYALLNKAPTRHNSKSGILTRTYLEQLNNLKPLNASLSSYPEAYQQAAAFGAGVVEIDHEKSANQVQVLFDELIQLSTS
jgi:chromosome partitioning protein